MSRRLRADALHPELRRVYRFLPSVPIQHPWALKLAQAGSRGRKPPTLPEGMHYRYQTVAGGDAVHVFTPTGERERAALLWIHGGGMVLGSAAQDHARLIDLARELDIVVVSVEYRLAPQHPYPAALDDCSAAGRWILTRTGDLGVDGGRIAIGGQSAGGGLAASLVQRIHDEGGPQPVAQWLFCPMLDDRTAANRSLDGVHHFLWNNTANRVGWTAYLAGPPGGASTPGWAVPARRADLGGLPPTWLGSGDIELFHAEHVAYAGRLTAAGVPCVLDTVRDGPHAFESIVTSAPVSRAYVERATSWLADRLAADDT